MTCDGCRDSPSRSLTQQRSYSLWRIMGCCYSCYVLFVAAAICRSSNLVHAFYVDQMGTCTTKTAAPRQIVNPIFALQARQRQQKTAFALALSAKKKKKKRSNDDNIPDDLPDFDLKEENDAPSISNAQDAFQVSDMTTAPPAAVGRRSSAKGSSVVSTKSLQELIQDRSLERKLIFDDDAPVTDIAGEVLPDLPADIPTRSKPLDGSSTSSSSTTTISKKRARQEARLAAAESRAADQEKDSVFSTLPFVADEQGKVRPLKVLETGTWAAIYILLAWEVYINSPFFDRAAPISPIVY